MEEIRLDDILLKLKDSGLRCTQARRAIVNLLVDEQGPFSTEEIHQKLRSHGCDLMTVYRNVLSLEKAGLVKCTDFGDQIGRYELLAESSNQHKIVCRSCKNSQSFQYSIPKGVLSSLRRKGFQEIEVKLEFEGLCADCQPCTH